MVQPLAYAHVGFTDSKGRVFTLIESDTPASKRYYFIPYEYRSSRNAANKPETAISLCTDVSTPTAVITGFLEPYFPPEVLLEIKQKYGQDIELAPLPMFSAGSVLIVSGLAETWGIAVDDRPDKFDDVPEGIDPGWRSRLISAAYKYKNLGSDPRYTNYGKIQATGLVSFSLLW